MSSVPEPRPNIAAAGCPFCNIADSYPAFNPLAPPPAEGGAVDPSLAAPQPETFMLLSTPLVLAFLDIAPLAQGHLLLCPRQHREKLTAATAAEARELGYWLRVLSAAVARHTGVDDWNVVQNNGAAAAQVVPHAHFHIIPRPEIREQGRWSERFTMFGRGTRTELDPDEALALAAGIRRATAEVLREEEAKAASTAAAGDQEEKVVKGRI